MKGFIAQSRDERRTISVAVTRKKKMAVDAYGMMVKVSLNDNGEDYGTYVNRN